MAVFPPVVPPVDTPVGDDAVVANVTGTVKVTQVWGVPTLPAGLTANVTETLMALDLTGVSYTCSCVGAACDKDPNPANSCGVHVHSGTECTNLTIGLGPHYFGGNGNTHFSLQLTYISHYWRSMDRC